MQRCRRRNHHSNSTHVEQTSTVLNSHNWTISGCYSLSSKFTFTQSVLLSFGSSDEIIFSSSRCRSRIQVFASRDLVGFVSRRNLLVFEPMTKIFRFFAASRCSEMKNKMRWSAATQKGLIISENKTLKILFAAAGLPDQAPIFQNANYNWLYVLRAALGFKRNRGRV